MPTLALMKSNSTVMFPIAVNSDFMTQQRAEFGPFSFNPTNAAALPFFLLVEKLQLD